jgi:hypothetical protein
MSNQNFDPVEMREAILEEVINIYNYAAAAAGWDEMPAEVQHSTDEIFRLVTKACGIKE